MIERNDCLLEIKKEMVTKLQEERTNNRSRYLQAVENLIMQSMIKLLEPSLKIRCREEDKADIEGMCKDLEEKYHKYMLEKTERDEYNCTLTVMEGDYLTDDVDQGCGGVILYTEDQRTVVPNMLVNRLNLAFEEYLPTIRETLFPANQKKK